MIILLASSAAVEQIFSTVKTPLQNHILLTTLDCLVQATMNGPEVDNFNPIYGMGVYEQVQDCN